MALEGIHVFDVVSPPVLPEQLVAEAQRIAEVPLALYVVDIDGSHLLRIAGPDRLPERIEVPLAIGPELDSAGLAELRAGLAHRRGVEVVPLWLRGRATGVLLTLGRPRRPLAEIARQAAAAITLADRYTDTFARGQRRKRPLAAAEIQQSLLPPRISRISGGELAGNVLPSYEVAGDWFDFVENLDGIWITLADGLGPSTRAAASSAVALGALRASRRSGGSAHETLMLMHRTLREMPGPAAEMTAIVARWDPSTFKLEIVNCGHAPPLVIRADRSAERLDMPIRRGLGGRASPRPSELVTTLEPGDRLILCSDGVIADGKGRAGLGYDQRRRGRAARRRRLRRRHGPQGAPRRPRRLRRTARGRRHRRLPRRGVRRARRPRARRRAGSSGPTSSCSTPTAPPWSPPSAAAALARARG